MGMYRIYLTADRVKEHGHISDIMYWLADNVGNSTTLDCLIQYMLTESTERVWNLRIPYQSDDDGDFSESRFLFRFSHYQDLIHFKLRWY